MYFTSSTSHSIWKEAVMLGILDYYDLEVNFAICNSAVEGSIRQVTRFLRMKRTTNNPCYLQHLFLNQTQ
jgi:hypothetical protein